MWYRSINNGDDKNDEDEDEDKGGNWPQKWLSVSSTPSFHHRIDAMIN